LYPLERKYRMEISIKKIEDKTILSIKGKLDMERSAQFQKVYRELIKKGDKFFLLDMSRVDHIDSSGLSILVNFLRNVRGVNGQLKLYGLGSTTKNIFSLTCLDNIFNIHENFNDATGSH